MVRIARALNHAMSAWDINKRLPYEATFSTDAAAFAIVAGLQSQVTVLLQGLLIRYYVTFHCLLKAVNSH